DNHGSHITGEAIMWAIDYKIALVAYTPYTTHFFQPLNVGLFSPLQTAYSTEVLNAAEFSGKLRVSKEQLEYYSRTRAKAFTLENIK
ncbi:hypothetical protein K458DRAFT_315116, partial [Lentithecium fluviatile CBS 122367]